MLPLLLVPALLAGAPAAASKTPAPRPCEISAFVNDPDPNGLNVRAEANAKSKVVGKLPTGAELRIDAVDRGWFRITHAEAEVEGEPASTEGLPQSGWVSGKMIAVYTRNYGSTSEYFLLEKPEAGSKVIVDPREATVTLLDCEKGWLKVSFEGKQGWLSPEGRCANTRTNCS